MTAATEFLTIVAIAATPLALAFAWAWLDEVLA